MWEHPDVVSNCLKGLLNISEIYCVPDPVCTKCLHSWNGRVPDFQSKGCRLNLGGLFFCSVCACVCAHACMHVLVLGRIYLPPLFQAEKWSIITYKEWLSTGYVAMVFHLKTTFHEQIYVHTQASVRKWFCLVINTFLALFFSFKSHFSETTFFQEHG